MAQDWDIYKSRMFSKKQRESSLSGCPGMALRSEWMICFRKKRYLAAGLYLMAFAAILTLCYLQALKHSLQPKLMGLEGKSLCRGKFANNTISVLRDNQTFIIAPYFDNRVEKSIRVISMVHHKNVKQHYCWFCCPDREEVYISKAVINIHTDRFGFPYGVADLICMEPINCDPRFVVLDSFPKEDVGLLLQFEIKNRLPTSSMVEFTVCISTMFGHYNNVLQFVQSIEMYKILGVQKVVIYKNSCSQLMEKVLEFYVAEGIVEIVTWPITSYLKVSTDWHFTNDGTQIGYYGQIAALNDCIYRNMYRSKYILLNDIDEIILPVKHINWKTMMESLEKRNPNTGVFLFENHIFPNDVFAPNSINIPSWDWIPGVNILQHVFREPDRKRVINPRKMIVDPRKVVQTSVHSVLRAFGPSVQVPMKVAIVYHCRNPIQPNLPRKFLIKDTNLWRYKQLLIHRVTQVLQDVPLNKV